VLVYDRDEIGAGQLWRLASGHLVHFSALHLVANLGVLLIAGVWLELHNARATLLLYAAAMPFIGVVLWLFEPALSVFGGASGLVFAVLGALALEFMARPGRRRALGAVLLAGLCIKLAAEIAFGWSTGAIAPESGIVAVPASHAAGFTIALIGYPLLRKRVVFPKKNTNEGESHASS
jgi:rhomboid family GlyGly-CTERM serine protease